MKIIQNILTDKGSKYSVSGGLVYSKLEAQDFIKNLKRNKKFQRLHIIHGDSSYLMVFK